MIDVGNRHHRSPGGHNLAEFSLPDQHDAGDGSGEDGIGQLHPGHLERFTGERKIRASHGNFFLAGALNDLIVGLLAALVRRLRAFQVGCGVVEIFPGDALFGKERLTPSELCSLQFHVRLGVDERLLRRLDFLDTAPCHGEFELGFARAHRSFVHAHLLPIVIVVQPRQQVALFDVSAPLELAVP